MVHVLRAGRATCRPEAAGVEVRPGEAGTRRVDALPGSARRADPDFDPLEVRAAERAGGAGGDSGSQEAQARASGGGIDDQDECGALDSGDPETFRSGHVEVAFEGFFAAPELVRAPYQRSGDGRIVGDDGANRLPWTGAFGVRHEFSVQTFMQGLLTNQRGCRLVWNYRSPIDFSSVHPAIIVGATHASPLHMNLCATAGAGFLTMAGSDRQGVLGASSRRKPPGTSYPQQPRTFTRETTFGNLAHL